MTEAHTNTENRKVPKIKHLTSQQVSALLAQAKLSRYPVRDQALILLTYRHGLRASEAVAMTWAQVDLAGARLIVQRLKGSDDSNQVLEADEVRLLKKLKAAQPDSFYVFQTERGTPMSADGFLKLMTKLGKDAGFPFKVHPHQLRHGAGFALAAQNASTRSIQAFLGHKNINHTVLYTKTADSAFLKFGRMIGGKV